uniref:Putative secreted protein ovary overexpressed n=1 Tax=Rhipicephalus microplus TaxID=6941 RepID=A0A6M2D415_RHIMP
MQTLTASVFVCSIMVIVAPTPKEKDCEIENLDMYYAITNFLNKISTYKRDVQRISLYEGLLFIECCNVTGLEQLRQYGPVLPHCSSFHPMFEVDIVSDGPIEVVMNWMTYAGMKGTLTVGAQLTRFSLTLQTHSWLTRSPMRLELLQDAHPLATERTYVGVTGVSDIARAATTFLSSVLPSVTERLWNHYFFIYLHSIIDSNPIIGFVSAVTHSPGVEEF